MLTSLVRRSQLFLRRFLQAGVLALSVAHGVYAAAPIKVPMTAEHWSLVETGVGAPKSDIAFVRHEGFPQGILALKTGELALKDLNFRNGTIEFDIKPIGEDIPGIRFRQRDANNAEEFYVRSFPDCRASDDCIQYSPVIRGFMLWDSYPQYQTAAPMLDGWNHVKLVVSGRRMNVFINRSSTPVLAVGDLQAETLEGGIQLRGPAYFANLVVIPDTVEGLPGRPFPDPAAGDRGILRQWQLSPLVPYQLGSNPAYAEMPGDLRAWKSIASDSSGMVNLNRQFDADQVPPALVWLRSDIASTRDETAKVSMGWLGQVWVFINGKLVAGGKNFYYPESDRRSDGRLSWDNGSFPIPLRKGNNEVAIALYSAVHEDGKLRTRYGWGLEMRMQDMTGLKLASGLPTPPVTAAAGRKAEE